MRIVLCLSLFITLNLSLFGQSNDQISTIDFIEVLNNHHDEALYYYQNNWQVFREAALKKGYIHSYQLLETSATKEAPFSIIRITTFSNSEQYEQREERFSDLIEENGPLKLANSIPASDFKKIYITRRYYRMFYI